MRPASRPSPNITHHHFSSLTHCRHALWPTLSVLDSPQAPKLCIFAHTYWCGPSSCGLAFVRVYVSRCCWLPSIISLTVSFISRQFVNLSPTRAHFGSPDNVAETTRRPIIHVCAPIKSSEDVRTRWGRKVVRHFQCIFRTLSTRESGDVVLEVDGEIKICYMLFLARRVEDSDRNVLWALLLLWKERCCYGRQHNGLVPTPFKCITNNSMRMLKYIGYF